MKKTIVVLLILVNIIFWGVFFAINARAVNDRAEDISRYKYQELDFKFDESIILKAREKYEYDKKIYNYIDLLSNEEKVSQLLFVNLEKNYISDSDKEFFAKNNVGGVYFGAKNITSDESVRAITKEINSLLKTPPFLATDQEGGSVIRLWSDLSLAGTYYISTNDTPLVAYHYGLTRTKTFKNLGLNFNFAPVLDLQYNGSYIYNRALSHETSKVSSLGGQIIKGQQDGGVISAMKYFPGTGASQTDPKNLKSDISIDKSQLAFQDLIPFKENFKNADAIITSHAWYPKIDPEYQTTFSKIIITDILKNEYKYEGLVLTDDLNSQTVDVESKYKKAFLAGHDLLFSSSDYSQIKSAIQDILKDVDSGKISIDRLNESLYKIVKFKEKYSLLKL